MEAASVDLTVRIELPEDGFIVLPLEITGQSVQPDLSRVHLQTGPGRSPL